MTHLRNRAIKNIRPAVAALTVSIIARSLILSGSVPTTSALNADATNAITGLATHSSFHYEMVRVLAVLAGCNKNEAEDIALAGEAVDLGTFTGYKVSGAARTITIGNTGRFGPNGLLYHFARRSSQYEKVEAQGSVNNTCEYFKNGNPNNKYRAPCTNKGPELDQIKNWAFDLPGPKPTAGQLPLNAQGKPVPPKKLVALGIYLHAIGDSYSHERCMMDQSWRFHKPNPFACNTSWHTDPRGDFGEGEPFTQTAANEVWRALRQYKGAYVSDVPSFASEFIAMNDACARVRFAVDTFSKLTNQDTVITCPAANSGTSSPPAISLIKDGLTRRSSQAQYPLFASVGCQHNSWSTDHYTLHPTSHTLTLTSCVERTCYSSTSAIQNVSVDHRR